MSESAQKQIRIFIVDSQALTRAGLRMIIEECPEMVVVGEAGSKDDAVRMAAQSQPEIILVDLDCDDYDAEDLVPELLKCVDRSRLLALAEQHDPEVQQRAVRAGALGFVQKSQPPEILIKAIQKVNVGEVWLDRSILADVITNMTNGKRDPDAEKIAAITSREREIIKLIAQGLNNQQIADKLFISKSTVRHHVSSIFSKLQVSDRLKLVFFAYRHKIAKPPR